MRIVILGAGIIGSAVAYFLQATPGFEGEVLLVERDPSYARASSARSAGAIRQQFSHPLNIAMSQFGWRFLCELDGRLANDPAAMPLALREHGYLHLGDADDVPALHASHAVQRAHGADVRLIDPYSLHRRWPWMRTLDLALGSLGMAEEGWFDGYAMLQALRAHALRLGVRALDGEVVDLKRAAGRIRSVQLADGRVLDCDAAVNAAGPWAAQVARMADIALPVRPQRRCVFEFRSPEAAAGCPLVVDPSGLWFRPEGPGFLAGITPRAEPDDLPLEVDYTLWDKRVWPALAHRVPGFEAARMTRAWAGYYELNTFDGSAIVGRHPDCENFYFANGFSGRGMQHAPAAGRGLAELILHGGYRSLDLSILGFERILGNAPLQEAGVIG